MIGPFSKIGSWEHVYFEKRKMELIDFVKDVKLSPLDSK